MALPFFYEPEIPETATHFILSEESSKHCIQVLRMKSGASLQLTNGKGKIHTATIISEDKRKTVVLLEEAMPVSPPSKKITIAISLLKNVSRFEWFLEKATEIGISTIQPLICERTEHTRFRYDRMHSILIAAILQSQQAWIPVLHEPVSFDKLLTKPVVEQQLIAHCENQQKRLIKELPLSTEIRLLIGPEGDFTTDEINKAVNATYLPVSLGDTRLRTETAGIVAASLLINR